MHDANIASQEAPDEIRKAPLPLRDDTILGVCEGLGEDFGFNPLPLRIALSAGLLWNPAAVPPPSRRRSRQPPSPRRRRSAS